MTNARTPEIEIAVQDVHGAKVAREAGADRIELCVALGATGGLTPSAGLLRGAVETGIDVHALIRSRPGDFVYTDGELTVLEHDIHAAVDAGCAGVVIGVLTDANAINRAALDRLVAAAGEVTVTFHRAADVALAKGTAPEALISQLSDAGVGRVLTSGGAPRVGEGLLVLTELVRASAAVASPVQVMAGGGVTVADIGPAIQRGVDAVHLSAKRTRTGGAVGPGGGSSEWEVTDVELVRAAVAATRASVTSA